MIGRRNEHGTSDKVQRKKKFQENNSGSIGQRPGADVMLWF